ncbi:integrase family protein [Nitrosospira sp. Nsp13]|uniref:tyrosine-type recombinase/integrase n=1 Tax=Nitrosospira sp. Nsp13 TaxID=1855332 RepID=UPI0020C87EAB|nr:integrase family protein [Nitrosospira sp. Nsp13]
MAREKLTPSRILDFKLPPQVKQAFLWDTDTKMLAVRVTSGAKAYIFQSPYNGTDLRMTIGSVEVWDIASARKEARRLQSLIDQGIDPRLAKANGLVDAEAQHKKRRNFDMTVSEAWTAYINSRQSHWSARHLLDHQNIARLGGSGRKLGQGKRQAGPLAALMPLKLSMVTPEVVSAWMQKENTQRPTYGALAYRLLRAFIRWAAQEPEFMAAIDVNAVGAKVTRNHVKSVKPKDGDCLQREQLPLWFKAVRELGNPVQAAYLQTLLLTGARREELAPLKWDQLDFQWNSMVIRDKVEGERTLPLTPFISNLLMNLPRRSQWVFSSPAAKSGRIQEPRIAHNRALKAAGLPHLSLHGLRRSFGTLAEWVECPAGVIAQLMGHAPSAIAEKHYRRRPLDLLRVWHTRIEDWIICEADIPPIPENIPKLRISQAA